MNQNLEPAVLALLNTIVVPYQTVWDPECGDGQIARAVQKAGIGCLASDERDTSYGTGMVDFLRVMSYDAPAIISHPRPHANYRRSFIRHGKDIGIEFMALLMNATFFHSSFGLSNYEMWPPRMVIPLTWLANVNANTWYVWGSRVGEEGMTQFLPGRAPKNRVRL